eukprot:TRINITY_DN25976_c0_g1_i1.p1 TRINITY_DN25976_c0_g1~~TRINITY_DN25976_c0_g1_i1.p1  ORF type:complete len:558 (+),score=117.15 TRINITY_DN25976_c0_g1_i1:84-1757(+)
MLFPGSRVSIVPESLCSTDAYDGARGDVLHYDEGSDRYAVELIHPKFARKKLLCRPDVLEFHFAVLPDMLAAAHAEVRHRPVEFKRCQGFAKEVRESDQQERFGKALVATSGFNSNDLVLVDSPFLVVSNPASSDRWLQRWDCYFEVSKRAQTGSKDVLAAFEEMDYGGGDVVSSLRGDAEETLSVLWATAGHVVGREPSLPKVLVDQEVAKLATVFSRWQTNQHEFPCFRGQQRRALYWLAPKVAHSCDPNVGWEDPDARTGRVELRALRPIAVGEVLGVNYMDVGFLGLTVTERQKRIRTERKFSCLCARCLDELQSLDFCSPIQQGMGANTRKVTDQKKSGGTAKTNEGAAEEKNRGERSCVTQDECNDTTSLAVGGRVGDEELMSSVDVNRTERAAAIGCDEASSLEVADAEACHFASSSAKTAIREAAPAAPAVARSDFGEDACLARKLTLVTDTLVASARLLDAVGSFASDGFGREEIVRKLCAASEELHARSFGSVCGAARDSEAPCAPQEFTQLCDALSDKFRALDFDVRGSCEGREGSSGHGRFDDMD